ncbi:uncharacterized protein LOC123895000 [Trifolium pratense]|uniref:uncharacterized protein LOC123895000 n=1 Tax=Trifolium pratense TaxID=57577 RepID=UPI001E697BD5|nr:uncharacterized protein LOC123895000 [Trifolium pratense]
MKARVFSKYEAKQEELAAIERDPSLKGKTRKEMGLLEFTGTQIRSNICGINLTFSPIYFNALLGLNNSGLVLDDFEKDTRFREELLHRMCIDMKMKGKVKGLTEECRVLFKIILSTISPRVGGTDTISWPHRHLIYFLLTERKVNLGHIVQNLKKFYPELMAQKFSPEVLNASFLTKMHLINTKLVQPKQEFKVSLEDRLYVDGFLVISELDAEHIIQDYLKVLKDEGYTVDRSMVPKAPVNMYKPKRKLKRKADSQEDQVKPDLLAQKKVKVEQTLDEQRTKKKHEAATKTLGARLRKRQVPDSKGKTPKYTFNEAEIGIGFTKPLRTIHPKSINISTSDNPLSELEKHLSPDPLNNQPFTHETNKSSSPPKPKSPQPQPQQESPDIPSSEPQPDIPTTEQASPTKQPSLGDDIKSVIGKRDMEVVHLMKEGLARAGLKRLTMYSHEENERAKFAAVSAAVRRLTAFKDCWVDSKLFKSLEDQRIENERLAEAAARIAQQADEMNQEDAPDADVLMIDYQEDGEPSSNKGKAPMDSDQLRVLQDALRQQQEALERHRSNHQNLESKVDKLDSKVDSLNDKFDILLAFLQKPWDSMHLYDCLFIFSIF